MRATCKISDSNGTSSVAPGQALVYEVLVANAGPYAVNSALLDGPGARRI
jgi:hypothetical protein